ncbi:putative HSP20-like chaperone [Helianthus annuus]|uniref:HSP20-like chaperone n=1 Tax=Helianthus annuus TaxID=4232 RepID=A0A251VMM0_HELAN|nr:putative HSP20-like chaperone [Helianthus annuus]KAJ0610721.1 putative HSP20-like chaperone [Helianthus annuus]KAJ0621508.1 putative HSP20-like chaperone, NudC family [Helianthus annuus]
MLSRFEVHLQICESMQEVNVTIHVPPGIESRFIACEITKNHIKVGLKSQPPNTWKCAEPDGLRKFAC